jgi:Rrf2 family protein
VVLPRTAEYAVRAVLRVAAGGREPVRVSDIADAVDAPRNYLAKTLNVLARSGVLAATRGPGGGFRLAMEPEALTLARVVEPFAADDRRRCLLRDAPCGTAPDCAAHDRWKPAAVAIDEFFRSTTIADLLAERAAPVVQPSSPS